MEKDVVGSLFLGYPDAREAFITKYPKFIEDCEPLVRFVDKIKEREPPNEPESALYSQIGFAWELFAAVVTLVSAGFPLAAIALGRSLMEAVMGARYLTDHPERLGHFRDEAEYVVLKVMKNLHEGTMEQGQKDRYKELRDRYGNRGWHGMSIEDLARETGFGPAYDTFYREACTITHAGALPLLTPRYGVGCRDIEATDETADGRDYGSMALIYAVHMIFSMLEWSDLKCNFGYDQDLKQFWESCERRGWFVPSA
jgi:Family of unknown function (DUF5677)